MDQERSGTRSNARTFVRRVAFWLGFATLVLGIVDPAGRLVVSNADHPRALVLRRDGSNVRLDHGGLMLGAFDEPRLEEEEV